MKTLVVLPPPENHMAMEKTYHFHEDAAFPIQNGDFPAGNRRKSLPRWLDFASQMIVVHQDWLKSLATARTKWANKKWGKNGSNMVKCCVGWLDVWMFVLELSFFCHVLLLKVSSWMTSRKINESLPNTKISTGYSYGVSFIAQKNLKMKWICKLGGSSPFFPELSSNLSSCQFGGPSPSMGFCQ